MNTSRQEALRLFRERAYSIYALVDPRDGRPRYIGRSVNAEARAKAHVNGTGHGKARCAWVAELKALGLAPRAVVLATAVGVAATIRAEQWWVDFGRDTLGWPLVNRVGGTRGGVWSLGQKRFACSWSTRDFARELKREGLPA